ncbi:mechanosensitive ion channel family protein [Simiduia agarivorans]|uniref:Small-conductance mechanosensitive channel n=1 Tax=Simiduia agarivorans (strain DSM 21679 / JCM 13881 / BCRC 17597 / SA1) TaxID=1117647 RepID=K4KMX9_SIMAS|nr:mechanosensitive ion channel domain-containing protein [Simiduia agarivorans]AFU99453.1 mechanosensitive channel [Simiduia agarivorans SA1 = DSM 21679]
MEFDSKWIDHINELAMTHGPKILMALIVLWIGWKLIGVVTKVLDKGLEKSGTELTLRKFLGSLIGSILKVMLVISVASMIGIQTTSFIAVLGAAGLAVGLALQGSLSNFAGGVLILLFKPFKSGDFIEAQGIAGKVADIQIFVTRIITGDNKMIFVPNGPLANGNIINYSAQTHRRVDFVFGIGYGDSIDKARDSINKVIAADERIIRDEEGREPLVVISALADSSVNFTVRVWTKTEDYWGVYFAMQENVKKTFDADGVSIPFPQRDVHIHQAS